jgi:CRP-like cAMP-binding protein
MAATGNQRVGFLDGLEAADREEFKSRSRPRRFRAGSTLMYTGQAGDDVMVLVSGRVKVTYLTEDGRELILDFRGPGELLGEMAVADGHPRSSTVAAVEAVEALTMASTDFRDLVASRPSFANALLQTTLRRFRDSDRRLIEFGASHTIGRVAARLVEMVERFGAPTPVGYVIDLPISQEELAGWTGSSREAVAKALHVLREAGLITTERRRITVLNLERLKHR